MDVAEINRLLDEGIANGAPKEATETNPNKENRFLIPTPARALLNKILRDYNKKEAKSTSDPRHYLHKINQLLDQSNLADANAPEKLDGKQRDLLDGVLLQYVKTLNEDDNKKEPNPAEEGAAKANLGKTPKTKSALEQEEAELAKGKEKFAPKNPWPMQAAALDTTFADNYTAAAAQIQKTAGSPSEFITSFTGLLQLEGQLANFLSAIAEGTFADEDVRRMVANGLKSYITAYIGKMIVNKEGDMLKEVAKNDMPGYATAILQKVRDQIAVPRIPPAAAPSATAAAVGKLAAKGVAAVKEHGPGVLKSVTEKFNQMRGKPAADAKDKTAAPPHVQAAAPPQAPAAPPPKLSLSARASAKVQAFKDKVMKKKEAKDANAPKVEAPKVEAPKKDANAPKVEAPKVEAPKVSAADAAAHAAEVQRMNRADQLKGTAGKEQAQAKAAQAASDKAAAVAKGEALKTELAALKAQASKGTPEQKLAAKAQIEAKTTQIAQQKDVVKGHDAALAAANKQAQGPDRKELAQIKATHALEDKKAAEAKGDALKKELDALKNAPPTATSVQELKAKEAELAAHQTVLQKTEADSKAANRDLDIKTTNRGRAATMHAADAARNTGRFFKNLAKGTARAAKGAVTGTAKATSDLATNVRLNSNLSKAIDRAKYVTDKYDQLKTTANVKDALSEEKRNEYERVKREAEEKEELYAKKKKEVKTLFKNQHELELKQDRIQAKLDKDPNDKVLKHDLDMAKMDFKRANDLYEARNEALKTFEKKMVEAENNAEEFKATLKQGDNSAAAGGTRRKRARRQGTKRRAKPAPKKPKKIKYVRRAATGRKRVSGTKKGRAHFTSEDCLF